MNVEDKQYLFDNLFRHIERNVDFDSCFPDAERGKKVYDEFMFLYFGDTYYGKRRGKEVQGTYAEKREEM